MRRCLFAAVHLYSTWEHVVQMCRHLHPDEEEEVVAAGVEAYQLDREVAEAAEIA
jgi:hypothetical protein